jgi:hypothetical protein
VEEFTVEAPEFKYHFGLQERHRHCAVLRLCSNRCADDSSPGNCPPS